MQIEVGLTACKEGYLEAGSDETQFRVVDGLRVLTISPPADEPLGDLFISITHSTRGIAVAHSGSAPLWVSCPDNPGFEALLADTLKCAQGKPADVEETHFTLNGPPGVDTSAAPAAPETV
jgi:hypothetical protein